MSDKAIVLLDSDKNIRTVSGESETIALPNDPTQFLNGIGAFSIPGGGGGFVHQAKVILNNDQIIALPTTAIEIVAAQGENTIIVPTFAWLYLHWADDYGNIGDTGHFGIEYTGTASSNLSVLCEKIGGGAVGDLLADGASHPAFLGVRNNVYDGFIVSGVGQFIDDPGTINVGISVYASNTGSHTGNYSGGDPDNTLTVGVMYSVFNTTTGLFT